MSAMNSEYDHKEIESKWQKYWLENKTFKTTAEWTEEFDTRVGLSTSFAYLKLALDQWLLQRLNCIAATVIGGYTTAFTSTVNLQYVAQVVVV